MPRPHPGRRAGRFQHCLLLGLKKETSECGQQDSDNWMGGVISLYTESILMSPTNVESNQTLWVGSGHEGKL